MSELLWWHRVGQRVVCIDDSPVKNPGHPPLMLRAVYLIAEVYQPAHASGRVLPVCLGFAEHLTPFVTQGGGKHWLWEHFRFRPARETSIESLRALLNPTPETTRFVEDIEHV